MVYDAALGLVLLYGGYSLDGDRELDDLWAWDGVTWLPLAPEGPRPSPRSRHSMVYDPVRGKTYLFGGMLRPLHLRDLWSFDGERWREETPPTDVPPAVGFHALASIPSSTVTLVLGGASTAGALSPGFWTWDGARWHAHEANRLSARAGHALALHRGVEILLFGGFDQSGFRGDSWLYDSTGWREVAGVGPSPRARHALGEASKAGEVILYGGSGDSGRLDDTWSFDEGRWTLVGGPSPPAREAHAMALDEAGERVVLFGGLADSGVLNDTWAWTREGWRELQTFEPRPSPRHGHTLSYDPERERIVLFGGSSEPSGGALLGDTWELWSAPDQRAGLIVEVSLAENRIDPRLVRGVSALVDGDHQDVLAWDVWEGRWRDDYLDVAEERFARLVDAAGVLHLLIRGKERTALHVEYFELTVRHTASAPDVP